MRAKVRETVNIDGFLDISTLTPLQKLSVGVRVSWRKTKWQQRKQEKLEEARYREQMKKEESLKEILLTYIYNELVDNRYLQGKGARCTRLVLFVKREVLDVINSILKSREFDSFKISFSDCDPDMLRSFDDLPVKVIIQRKIIGRSDSH